jgi:hypothetical protein
MPNFHLVAADGLNPSLIQAAPGSVSSYKITNNAGYQVFVKLHDIATVPTPGVGVVYTIGAQASLQISDAISVEFANGIGLTITKGVLDNDTTPVVAGDCVVDIGYSLASASSGGSGGGSSSSSPSVSALRILLNDQSSTEFTDSELQTFLDIAQYSGVLSDSALFLAASLGTNSLVVKYGSIPVQEVSIGGFQTSAGRTQVRYLESQADRFYQLYIDAPAFGIAEDNLSSFNELAILRNWILRTQLP